MTPSRISWLLAVTVFAALVSTPGAHAQETDKKQLEADTATLAACIDTVGKNNAKVPLGDQPIPQPGVEARLNTARDEAKSKPESCIGIIANPCLGEDAHGSTAGMVGCQLREAAAWDARLNAAYKKIMASSQKPVVEGYRNAQRAWITYRDASCDASTAKYEGGTAGHIAHASCYMELTARQALWLELAIPED